MGPVVPEYEQRSAAVHAHIPWPTFKDMDMFEKASVIAHYRMYYTIEAFSAQSREMNMKRQAALRTNSDD